MDLPCSKQIPLEVVSVILSKLGRNELLNTRLVCQSWNREALRLFRLSNFTTALTIKEGGQVNELRCFLKYQVDRTYRGIPEPKPFHLAPFHLDIHLGTFNPSCTPTSFMGRLMTDIKKLFEYCGPKCVTELTLRSHPCTEFRHLFRILALTSQGLKVLDLSQFPVMVTHAEASGMSNYGNLCGVDLEQLTFPDLRILKCYGMLLVGLPTHPIYSLITARSPNLEVLKLKKEFIWHFASFPNIPFKTLKTFRGGFVGGPLNTMLDQITKFPPLIQTFSLEQDMRAQDGAGNGRVLRKILEALSPTLQHLKMKFLGFDQLSPHLRPSFPNLPHLKSLQLRFGFESEPQRTPLVLDSELLNFSQEALPRLETLSISSACHFAPNHLNPESRLPNITALTIFIYDGTPTSSENQATSENLFATFPNIVKVVLKQDRWKPGQGVKCGYTTMLDFLTEFLCSGTDAAATVSTIEVLEVRLNIEDLYNQKFGKIEDHPQNFLGKLGRNIACHIENQTKFELEAKGSPALKHYAKLRNVKCLRLKVCGGIYKREQLRIPAWRWQTELDNMNTIYSGNISRILSHFPNVSQLELSQLFLSAGSKRFAYKKLEEIREIMPNMTINLL